MRQRSGLAWFAVLFLLGRLACGAPAGVEVTVTGGNVAVTDWIAEVTLDLATVRQMLGSSGQPDRVTVYETTGQAAAE